MKIRSRSLSLPHAIPQHYYVDSFGRWFVIRCKDKRMARRCGVKEFGRGNVKTVRQADNKDLEIYFRHQNVEGLDFEEDTEL